MVNYTYYALAKRQKQNSLKHINTTLKSCTFWPDSGLLTLNHIKKQEQATSTYSNLLLTKECAQKGFCLVPVLLFATVLYFRRSKLPLNKPSLLKLVKVLR